jgi:hypothetical protein
MRMLEYKKNGPSLPCEENMEKVHIFEKKIQCQHPLSKPTDLNKRQQSL